MKQMQRTSMPSKYDMEVRLCHREQHISQVLSASKR